jgi:hypothetical protein
MSRGLGRIQRAILDVLPPDGTAGPFGAGITTTVLAKQVYGPTPTSAQLRSLRRAVRSLEAAGLVRGRRSAWWRGGRRLVRLPERE